MRRELSRSKSHSFPGMLLIIIVFICCLGIWRETTTSNLVFAQRMTTKIDHSLSLNCQFPVEPNSQSLLVVLLDRSGSLTQGSSPTDPNGYSTSVTKALADLWPGDMAVIPFRGDTTTLPIFGPDTLSDLTQRADLKDKVQNNPIGGDTPLEPAMQEALNLLHQNGTPPGSRVIVITDGNPTGVSNNDGTHQENAIRKILIPSYCQHGIPVSVFGLTIDPKKPDGQDANRLLTDIATGTGTTYTNVTGPEDLAKQVTRLYAEWQDLTFTQVKGQGNNFPVSIDPFAQQVSFVTFHSDSSYQITLIGPNNQAITTGVQKSAPADAHYEIDRFVISGPIQPGTYTINTSGDPDAQVYILVNSPLHVKLVAPTLKTIAYADKPVQIETEFLNGTDEVTPTSSDGAQIVAKVTLLVNGRPAGPPTNDIVLTQQSNSPIFSGQTLMYIQPGELQIELDGTYRNVPRQTSFTLQLLKPLLKPIPPPPCSASCVVQRYGPLFIGIIITLILLALAAWVIWALMARQRNQPKPYGYLTNGRPNGDVELDRFKKPRISSDELLNRGNFNLRLASFELVFPQDGTVQIRTTKGNGSRVAIDYPGELKPKGVTETPIELQPGRKIYVDGNKVASFETSPRKQWVK